MDANFNRAQEALRVCEDIVRLSLHRRTGAQAFKRLRHAVRRPSRHLSLTHADLVGARDVARDVGRRSLIAANGEVGLQDLFVRNIRRAAEALRVLEEVSKATSLAAARAFQRLRFSVYDLERKTLPKF